MKLAPILKDIGRGREGARDMDTDQAREVFEAILQGRVADLELGAFCAAMRIKGESPAEMDGFLQATAAEQARLGTQVAGMTPIVLSSYNGSRRLALLTPLLALLLARRGLPVVVHGMATEDARVHAFEVFDCLGLRPQATPLRAEPGRVTLVHTATLVPGLARLLDVRRLMGLRNSAHSLVKLMNPCEGRGLVVGSYTHPEYAVSMAQVFERMGADAVLLRGTEGEPVADPRRMPAVDGFIGGHKFVLRAAPESGSLREMPALPPSDAASTANWAQAVLDGRAPIPGPLREQVDLLEGWHRRLLADAASRMLLNPSTFAGTPSAPAPEPAAAAVTPQAVSLSF